MAQDQTQDALYDYMYSKYLMKDLFGITMTNDDFVELSYIVFREIGNIATATHSFELVLDNNLEIDLPCNCEFIESVTTGSIMKDEYNDFIVFYNLSSTPTITTNDSSFLPDVIDDPRFRRHSLSRSHLHGMGEFLPYELSGSACNKKMTFDRRFIGTNVNIIYRGTLIDDDKNPLITMKIAMAIAYKMAFIQTQKKAFMGDRPSMELLSYIKPEAERKMAAAKIPEYLSQNFWDRVLSAKTRHDRKVFWSSYKLMQ